MLLKTVLTAIATLLVTASLIIIYNAITGVQYTNEYSSVTDDDYYAMEEPYDESCSIAGVLLRGELMTYYDTDSQSVDDVSSADDILFALATAEANPDVKAVLLEIDSYGGSPIASQELANYISTQMTKPVVSHVRTAAASAAYWVAAATDHIVASTFSDIGSIGVTMSYIDESILNDNQGYTFNEINTGRFKDSGNAQKPLTAEERALFERDINIMYDEMVTSIAALRNLDKARIIALADGSTMLGAMAVEQGLIDELGDFYTATNWLAIEHGIDPVVCW